MQVPRSSQNRTARRRCLPRVHPSTVVFTEPHRAFLHKPETTRAHTNMLFFRCCSAARRDLPDSFRHGVLATALYLLCRLRQSHRSFVLPSASFTSCRCAATLSTGGSGILGNSAGLLVTSAV